MVQDDPHPIANKQGYRAKTQESKAPSSMPASTRYEHRGGHENVVHEPSSTQAKGKQAPSSLSRQSGFKDDVHEPSSTKAQGNQAPSSKSVQSTKYGSGYERQSGHTDVYEPRSTQAQGKQDPSSMSDHSTGYGNGYERSGFAHVPPSTQAQGSQGPSSMLDQSTGYGKPPSTLAHGKLEKGNVYGSNSAFHGSSRTEGNENKSHVQKPLSSDVIGNQSLVFSSDSRLVNDRFVSYNPPAYKPPPTETNQSHISLPCHGKGHARNPPPPSAKFQDQAPVGGSENPVHKQSLIEATRKPPDVPKSVPSDALPLGPETGHDPVNGHRGHKLHNGNENSLDLPAMETTPVQPSIQVNVNVFCDKDGTYRLSPGPPPPRPQPQPQPRHQPQLQTRPQPQTQLQPRPQTQSQPRPQLQPQPKPKPSTLGCCSIL